MIRNILANLSIVVLTVVVLVAAFYLVLKFLDWGLRRKSGSREQEGLTALWLSSQAGESNEPLSADEPRAAEPPESKEP